MNRASGAAPTNITYKNFRPSTALNILTKISPQCSIRKIKFNIQPKRLTPFPCSTLKQSTYHHLNSSTPQVEPQPTFTRWASGHCLETFKVKVQLPLEQATKAQKGTRL